MSVSEPGLLATFRDRVLDPDLDESDVLLPAGPPRGGRPTRAEREVALYRRLARWSCGGEYGHYRGDGGSAAWTPARSPASRPAPVR